MNETQFEALIGRIYDAAIDETNWSGAIVGVAEATGSIQCALQVYDARGFGIGLAPLMDPDFLDAYRKSWRPDCPVRRASLRKPQGVVYGFDDVIDRSDFKRSAIYGEWWRPQRMGFAAMGVNLCVDGPNMAVASVYKRDGDDYSDAEADRFAELTRHVLRATRVHRRMRLAALATPHGTSGETPGSVVVVDRAGRVLMGNDAVCQQLSDAGVLHHDGTGHRVRTRDGAIERLIGGAAHVTGGGCDVQTPMGATLAIDVIPVRARPSVDFPWLAADRPVALLQIGRRGAAREAQRVRLATEHGLTPAEAAVALEIAKGDGRAAAAARLGIRETTVRSHLSAIFDKIGVRRQAELATLVAAA